MLQLLPGSTEQRQCSFLGDQPLLCTDSPTPSRNLASGPLSNQSQRTPPFQLDCPSAKWWSLNIYHVHRLPQIPVIAEKKTEWVCQHLKFSALNLLLSGFCPQVTSTLYVSGSKIKQTVFCWKDWSVSHKISSFSLTNIYKLFFKKENFLLSKVPIVINDAVLFKCPFESGLCW